MIHRVALHSHQIAFKDLNNQVVEVEADYPKDFSVLIKLLRKYNWVIGFDFLSENSIFVSLFQGDRFWHYKINKKLDTNSFKTVSLNSATVDKNWVIVDADSQILGRMASEVAKMIRGKHKPSFTPHVDCGDNVIVINADKMPHS